MFKKQLATALAALLAVAACAPCAEAQSGRRASRAAVGRGLSGREFVRAEAAAATQEAAAPEGSAEGAVAPGGDERFDLRSLNAGRLAPVVYAEHGGKHTSRKGEVAAVALVGYLIFVIWVTANSNGYAPSGRGAGGGAPRLRR